MPGIHKFGIWPRADCPAHNKTVEAVDQRRQIHLAGWYLEFGNVGKPLFIRGCCPEVAVDEVLWCRAYFSTVGAVATSSGRGGGQPFLSHQTSQSHYLLRDDDLLPAQSRAYPTIAVATVIELEDACDDATRASILVSDEQACTVIEVGTASKPHNG